jgi:hypothetical protein
MLAAGLLPVLQAALQDAFGRLEERERGTAAGAESGGEATAGSGDAPQQR